ncbi:MAG: S24 family peptidase [Campylobacterales bacterium]
MEKLHQDDEEIRFEGILERLKEILQVGSDRQVALALGVAPDKLAYWKKRNTIPLKTLFAFAKERSVGLGWLLSGEEENRPLSGALKKFDLSGEEMEEFFARIPIHVDSDGNGSDDKMSTSQGKLAREHLFFPVHFLYLVLNDIYEKENLEAIYITHSSMEPTLRRGSLAIIDNQKTALEDGKIFFFAYGEQLYLKRVLIDIVNQTVFLKSDNDKHPPIAITDPAKLKELRVIGKVIGYIGRMD